MEEKGLLITALICSIVGIFIILSISQNIEPNSYEIKNITIDNLDEDVRIIGRLASVRETDELMIMNVEDETGSIIVIAFKNQQLNLTLNQILEIEGKVTEYNGKIEIEARKISSR